ncbi:MAG: integrase arm-type DNA-binding domain-containing protein [Methylocystis sp.]|jgi:integrase
MATGKLTARAVATTKPGRYGDGGGLWLIVSESGVGRWAYRFTIAGKVSEAGLGSRDGGVSLAEARDKAAAARKLAKAGVSPVEEKRQAKMAAEAAAAKPTFGAIAEALIAAKESSWRNEKHRQQWRMTLQKHAEALWSCPVDEIDTAAVLAVLTPLWATKPETASRLRGRIESVLDAAKVQKHRSGENPAAWRGHLAHVLPKRGKLTRGHLAAMDYADVPAFVAKLRQIDSVAALALEFTILTAARSGEVYGARWNEIDLQAKVWTIPAGRMKSAREHRVPLSDRALFILDKLVQARTGELVFEGQRAGRPLSHNAMGKVMSRLGVDGVTIHGFRSAFRDWAGNETHFPREVCEAALAHAVGNQTEQAYRRSDSLEKRRALMTAWANYLAEPTAAASNVVRLR